MCENWPWFGLREYPEFSGGPKKTIENLDHKTTSRKKCLNQDRKNFL
jgi:hypothetical protein